MIKIIKILFVFLISSLIYSQEYIYKEFGLNEGLPSSQVYDMYQAKNGLIWFATDRGLSCYNGYEFKNYGIKDGILNNVILDIFPQEDGNIYCNTLDNRVFYFNENFNGFFPYIYNHILDNNLKYDQHILSLYLDKEHNLHFGSNFMNGKIVISKEGELIENKLERKYQDKNNIILEKNMSKFPFFYLKETENIDLNKVVNLKTNSLTNVSAFKIKNKDLYVFKDDNLIYIKNELGKTISTVKNEKKPISISPIDENIFFIGYIFGGGKIVDFNGKIIEEFLTDKSITKMLIDKEGGYWFSTLYSGVYYVKEPTIRVINDNILYKTSINSLTKNKEEDLFIGLDNGNVFKIDKDKNISIEYNSIKNTRAYVEYNNNNNQLIVNSINVFYKKLENNKKIKIEILKGYNTKLSEPQKKGFLVSQINGLIEIKNNSEKIRYEMPIRVQDACFWKDEIYIGTPKGIYKLINNKMISLVNKNPLFESRIEDIDINEKRNELYFATIGQGVIIYNKNNEKITSIKQKDGLLSDIINELYVENENELWVCTNSGLNKITFESNSNYYITSLKSSNGLLNDGISDVEVIDDKIWIASKKGLVYAPKSLFDLKKKTNNYFLKIKKNSINDKSVSIEKLKNLSHKENRLELEFEGISFKKSNDLIYKYKLEGLDNKWYYTKNRKILYTSLPFGNYSFKIAVATLENEKDLKYLEIPIHIKAPLWKRSWFILLSILSLITLIYLFFKYRILSYNRDIIRELLRLMAKKIKGNEKYFSFKEAGKEIRIKSNTILYVKSSGNYIEIITEKKNYVVRHKIGDFIKHTPDPLEYIRIHRSFIVRMDKVDEKNNQEVVINGEKLPVSSSYLEELKKLIF